MKLSPKHIFRTTAYALGGLAGLGLFGLVVRRLVSDAAAHRTEQILLGAGETKPERFDPDLHLTHLPEVAARYLRHAIAPGTPLHQVCRLSLHGTMRPSASAGATALVAEEVLAPHRGFVWTATAKLNGVPVQVRDSYFEREGEVRVNVFGIVPVGGMSTGGPETTARSSRGRLVAEAIWCPMALLDGRVVWEDVGPRETRYTMQVDGERIAVTLSIDEAGKLVALRMLRWGSLDGAASQLHPYGFWVNAEASFEGVTIPSDVFGGWHYGTSDFDEASASTFVVDRWSAGAVVHQVSRLMYHMPGT